MNGEKRTGALSEALRALAVETEAAEAAPRVRARLGRELERRRWLRRARFIWPVAVAASLLVAGYWIGARTRTPEVAVTPAQEQPVFVSTPVEPALPAAPTPAKRAAVVAPRWSDIREPIPASPWYWRPGMPPASGGRIVLVDVAPETASQFGLPPLDGAWQAQVFVGDDGLTRAVRLVSARHNSIRKGEYQ